jgi:hypothetical protein
MKMDRRQEDSERESRRDERDAFNAALCRQKHEDEERRISMLETNYKEMGEKHDAALGRIHQRFDEVAKQLLTRVPPWVAIGFTILGALVSGLAVAAIKVAH